METAMGPPQFLMQHFVQHVLRIVQHSFTQLERFIPIHFHIFGMRITCRKKALPLLHFC